MPFRPAIVPTLATLSAAAITLNLSAWQYGRHLAQAERLAESEARLRAPPVGASRLADDPQTLKWRTAVLDGVYEADTRAFVDGQTLFGEPGYRVVETLRVDDGPRLLVDRGWVPAAQWDEHLADPSTPRQAHVEGLLLPITPGDPVSPTPADDTHPTRYPPEVLRWMGLPYRRIGIPWSTLAADADPVAPVYLVEGPQRMRGATPSRERYPVSGYVASPKVIGHLSYAGQWLLITGVMIVVWAWAGVLRGRRLASA